MATKKQKHAAALARREAFLAEEREIGRLALESSRRKREADNRRAWAKGHEKHYKFVDECPHCSDIKKQQAEEARKEAVKKIAAAAAKKQTLRRSSVLPELEAATA